MFLVSLLPLRIVTSLNGKITISNRAKIIDTNVAVSGGTAWQYITAQEFSNDYERYLIRIGVHGALYQSAIIQKDELERTISTIPYTVSIFWNDNNLGTFNLYADNNKFYYGGNVKTKDLAFDYALYGLY